MNFLSGKKKIITMILGVVSGLAIAFGLDQTAITVVAGAVVSAASVVGYLIAEGRIDVERVKNTAEAVNGVIDIFTKDEEGDDDGK